MYLKSSLTTGDYTGMLSFRDYEILSLLGRGGTGVVYRVRGPGGGEFALKTLAEDAILDSETALAAQRIREEGEILSLLHHRNIVTLHHRGEQENGFPYLVLDCVRGETLEAVLGSQGDYLAAGWSYTHAVQILYEVAETLGYLHREGVVHGDLSPHNIMIEEPCSGEALARIRFIDLGLTRRRGEPPTTRGLVGAGSSLYMAPEQIRNQPLDERADIYSFGALAFRIFRGEPPFPAESEQSIRASHLIESAPFVSDKGRTLPAKLDLMIGICLEKDPEHRYGSMEEITECLRDLQRSPERSLLGALKRTVTGLLVR